MISTVTIKVTAANPQAPLGPFFVIQDSAASVTIIDVPKDLGKRRITGVTLVAKNADDEERGIAAERVGSAWGATVPQDFFTRAGQVENGFVVELTGVDEQGLEETWTVGRGTVIILDATGVVKPGETKWIAKYNRSVPLEPVKGDIAKVEGVFQIYTPTGWQPLGGGGGDVKHSDFSHFEELRENCTVEDIRTKFNGVLNKLKGVSSCIAAALFAASAFAGVKVNSVMLKNVPITSKVVTNVTYTADAFPTNIVRDIAADVASPMIDDATNGLASASSVSRLSSSLADVAAEATNAYNNAAHAEGIATDARNRADAAQEKADSAGDVAIDAYRAAGNAQNTADAAQSSADDALSAASAAQSHSEATRAIVYTWEGFLDGSNVVFSITNYISGAYSLNHSKLEIKELRDGVYHTVYESRTEITNHTEAAKREIYGVVNSTAAVLRAEIAAKGDKAWGRRSSTGQEVPISNTVWVTEQNLRIAGGMEYERVAVGEGAVYVLASKGQTPYLQGDEGALMLKDDGGTNYFGMVRSDSYTIGCNTDGIRTDPANHLVYLDYQVTMSDHPVVWYMASLENYDEAGWEQLNYPDGSPVPGASHQVYWDDSPRLGAQECYINVGDEPSGFFRATIEVPGDCRFKTNMPAEIPSFWCTDDPTKKVKVIWNNGNPKFVEEQ